MAKRAGKPSGAGEDAVATEVEVGSGDAIQAGGGRAAGAGSEAIDADALAAEQADKPEPADRTDQTAPADATDQAASPEAQLQAEIVALKAKADEHWDRLLRTQAEMENLRKRSQRDIENAHKFALEGFASDLLGVKDSLEMGLNAASQEDGEAGGIREGTELTLKLLTQTLEKYNIIEINPLGDKFDPELHQAMNMLEDPNVAPNTVVMVIQKGYQLNGRLLRPALVSVAK